MTGGASPLRYTQDRVDPACCVETMTSRGCAVELRDAPRPHLVVDLDHADSPARRAGRKCDFIFVAAKAGGGLMVVPLELKSTGINSNTVARELQAGAELAEDIADPGLVNKFVPIAVHRSENTNRKQYKELARQSVRFRGRHFAIRTMECGDALTSLIGE